MQRDLKVISRIIVDSQIIMAIKKLQGVIDLLRFNANALLDSCRIYAIIKNFILFPSVCDFFEALKDFFRSTESS